VEWQARVAANAGKLADGSKTIREYGRGGALKRWRRRREEEIWRDAWRNQTPGERGEARFRIRWNRRDAAEATRAWEANHGGVGNPGGMRHGESAGERENRTSPKPIRPRIEHAGSHTKRPAARVSSRGEGLRLGEWLCGYSPSHGF
jgi:hypothetical protein